MSGSIAFLRKLLDAGMPLDMALTAAEAFEQEVVCKLEQRRAKDRDRAKARLELLPDDWAEIRLRIFSRDGWRCRYCGEATPAPQCDHVIPISRDGSSDDDNLVTACKPCNSAKGDRTPEEWGRPILPPVVVA